MVTPLNGHSFSLIAFGKNFLGESPNWYKKTIIGFLLVNPLLLFIPEYGPTIAGWVLVLEFIFTLAMALYCYPLQPGGLLALEAVILGLTNTETIYAEIVGGFPVILLLIFMVAGIYFMNNLLLFIFTKLLIKVRSKVRLSLLFCAVAAGLSAFLDALTVTAVVIAVAVGFYTIYTRTKEEQLAKSEDAAANEKELQDFRQFLRSLMMHAAVGTALGGVMTTVGEPQNLLIAERLDWTFVQFFVNMSFVTLPVFIVGLITCAVIESSGQFGYGGQIPPNVLEILKETDRERTEQMDARKKAELIVQALAAVFLVFALAFHLAAVGIVGLSVIVIQTAFNGVVEERKIGYAFHEALPFTALLCVFFVIVAVIHDQHLFAPISAYVLSLPIDMQAGMFYIANGLLSAISDNVFVATVYITEVENAFLAGEISRQQFDMLGVAINTGTNIPSVLTPNGQAAFLFLLTSSLAPLIRLSYSRMVWMALPYFVTMGITGWVCVTFEPSNFIELGSALGEYIGSLF